jgi:predicted nucleic acid-binding protein
VSKRRLVDTNLIVRYLVQDHEKHAKAAGKLFDACDRGDVVIVVLPGARDHRKRDPAKSRGRWAQ